ncbi:Hypothetical protein MCYN_0346 [Mycoplasmopsis cynos C142]|uniref:Uncharacterized protein n=1 Tax=Mycoplasmopsis cynos (strain C142) TaxID=1246955 RepID=L0RUI4_MYCC1|nr:Hypothetical protein MCYN_0346 [Mycoplasmopsis cynos C142]
MIYHFIVIHNNSFYCNFCKIILFSTGAWLNLYACFNSVNKLTSIGFDEYRVNNISPVLT